LAGIGRAGGESGEWQIWFSITGRDAQDGDSPGVLRPGTGEWKVNGKAFEEYFVTEQQRVAAKRTLVLVEMTGSFDVVTTVKSGGVAAQADASEAGIARALIEFNPELRKTLKAEGLLTRGLAHEERKKYGQKGARARFQFSKR